ncbi:MAG: ileS, partial [Jatrophihabitantaceae bacterium]|nr:ileS [Jatrophihabitantaceae bacterium]
DNEAYGVAEFNAKCRESVERHVGEFEAMSERMGYWADYDNPYRTMDPQYIESVWWALKTIFDAGLLVEDRRVAPYCPRCGTALSDHEVAQGYETVVDPSVYVRFPLTSGEWAGKADLLVWTTTPWTLVSNTAVAVNPGVEYVVARSPENAGAPVVVDRPLLAKVLGDDAEVLASYEGTALERWTYRRPFDFVEIPDAHYVVLAEYVTTEDGSGLVHQAPAFGADDLVTCRAYGLPVVNPIRSDGHFDDTAGPVAGVFFKDADAQLVDALRAQGLLWKHVPYEHAYPHCWRCHTPLMYYALPSWYVRTTEIKSELIAQNEATNWQPSTIKHGRYGDWLDNNVDWALSRDRYWGTPLPVWKNDADPTDLVCIGSLAELSQLTGRDLSDLDPHRPFIDDVTFAVEGKPGTYRRVPQVIDAWFDSGSMPFAQFGAPHRNAEQADAAYPADFICEAIDQTRGWFYTLMAVGTLVKGESSYRNVVCLGHILAEDGRKMSKHLGNILEPIPLMDRHGADAVRWFMLAGGSPWSGRRVGHKTLEEIASKVIRTYWSIASFQSLYAGANNWTPSASGVAGGAPADALDRWALSGAHRLAAEADEALDAFDTARAGKAIAAYIDDLSNWYVRRSRRRFWDGDDAALSTLHECLRILTLVMAPFTPFVTERVWGALFAGAEGVDSVHLATWPDSDPSLVDDVLDAQIALTRRLVELGRGARAEAKVKTRQPLARALISGPGWAELPDDLRREVAQELNVQELASLGDADELVDVTVKANFRTLGRRFGGRTQTVAGAIAAADAHALAQALRDGGTAHVQVEGETVDLTGDELVLSESPRSGWTVAKANADTVALDLELTPALRRLGIVRDVVRQIQDTRKSSGLEVTDRIELWWRAGGSPETGEALREHQAALGEEVLAVAIHDLGAESAGSGHDPEGADGAYVDDELGLALWIKRV